MINVEYYKNKAVKCTTGEEVNNLLEDLKWDMHNTKLNSEEIAKIKYLLPIITQAPESERTSL